MDSHRFLQREADTWRREGRISGEFREWLRQAYPARKDATTASTLQVVLSSVATLLVIVGIFTLVTEFWGRFEDETKLGLMVAFALASLVLGLVLHAIPRARFLGHFFLALPLPLYILGMVWGDFSPGGFNPGPLSSDSFRNPLAGSEVAIIVVGVAAALAALVTGLFLRPALAFSAPPALVTAIFFLGNYTDLSDGQWDAVRYSALGVVLALHVVLLALAALGRPRRVEPVSVRLALASNVPWGFALFFMIADELVRRDATMVGVLLNAFYLCLLLGFAIRFGLPELTVVAGGLLVVDAIVFGADKGGILGTALSILVMAGLLLFLAQRGILLRLVRPRRPSAAATGART